MSNIKKFIDKVATTEGRQSREVILTLSDAKELRDEIMKLLLDSRDQNKSFEPIEVVLKGNKW
jgi:hypothetical protein